MRVAHVVQDLDPAMGGLATVPINMARALAHAGVDVEIWTSSWHDAPLPDPSKIRGSLTLVERKVAPGFLDAGFLNAFRDDLARVDVVHTHSFWRPYAARFASACARIGKPIMHTMHGMLMEHPMLQKAPKKKFWLQLFGKRHMKRLNAVQMLNREESAQSAKVGCDFRFFELPNGVDVAEFASLPARGAWRATDASLADKIVILSMGRLHEMKGPDLLLGAFLDLAKERSDIALVMAGPEEGMAGVLQGMLRGHPAADRVRMPGLVRGEQRLALLADADIFAQTSRHETMSMSIIEAAYAMKPMVITQRCHFPEIGESGAGVVVPTSREGIAAGLKRMVESRERWSEYGRSGRRLIEEQFTLDSVTTRLMAHYQRLMRGEAYPWLLRTI
jgi:glycosyltransferase involved in cell wall biosynthesis